MKKQHRKLWTILALLGITLGGCANQNQSKTAHHASNQPQSSQIQPKSQSQLTNQEPDFQKLTYKSGENPIVIINNNKSTLNMNQWHQNEVQYQNLDYLNRTSAPVTAYLEPKNVTNDSLRTKQTWKPTGWKQKFNQNHEAILNRGHIIAYSLSKGIDMQGQYDPSQKSGDQNNPKNLFTQTQFCNQELQTIYETKVRNALKQGQKVIYQVQPIFKSNNKMASGVHMQAIGSNGLNFNVYLYNVQPEYKFNYQDGSSVVDQNMKVPTPPDAPHFDNH